MDKIRIKKLEVFANHGVFQEEKNLGQKFIISAVLYTNIAEAAKKDDLTKSIHYGEVSIMMKEFIESHTFDLLETVVERLAKSMLLQIPNLEKVKLTLEKPWAPVRLSLDTVGIEIKRQWHEVYLAIGSNMGDKEGYLDFAVKRLEEIPEYRVEKVSTYLVTKPYKVTDQDEFLNGCLKIKTIFTPEELLESIHAIEAEAHRKRTIHWGPRTLDIDILFYDNLIYDSEQLHIPHLDMHNREFVLAPLAEVASYKRHPILLKTVEQMLTEIIE